MDELLSLKWNNHCSTFLQVLSAIRNKQKYTDVTLACSGKFYSAHKIVLSTCSDYFEEIFDQADGKNIVVVLKDITSADLELLLDYMYLGEVSVKQTDLTTLLKAAECLQIKGLAVADDDEVPKKPTKAQSSPVSRRKRKVEDISDFDNKNSYISNRPKKHIKPVTYSLDDDPLKDIEAVDIKTELMPYEPETISVVEEICKEEYSQIGEVISNDPPDSPEAIESGEPILESSNMDTGLEDNRGTFSVGSFQGETSEWPNDDSNLNYTNSGDYGQPETSGQTPAGNTTKAIQCPYCLKKIANPGNLRLHIRTHTGEKPFQCQFCQYKSSRKDTLQYHQASKHHFYERKQIIT